MKKLFWLLALATLMSCSQAPQENCGFVQNVHGERISWKGALPVRLQIHESVPTEYRQAIVVAAQKWNQLSQKNLIQIDETIVGGESKAAKDNANVIYMNNTWDAGKESEQARTSVYWVGSQIREADIKLNGKNFNFYYQNQSTQGVNVEALVIHEMGHVLGLKHKDSSSTVMQTYLANNTDRTQIGTTDLESLKCEEDLSC
jgi:predicted Zn-dependent protease